MKRKNPVTHPAAQWWNFLSMLEVLEHCSLDDLLAMRDERLSAALIPLLAILGLQAITYISIKIKLIPHYFSKIIFIYQKIKLKIQVKLKNIFLY